MKPISTSRCITSLDVSSKEQSIKALPDRSLPIDMGKAKVLPRPAAQFHFLPMRPRVTTSSRSNISDLALSNHKAFDGKPPATAAILPDGAYVVALAPVNERMQRSQNFELFGPNEVRLGNYEVTTFETVDSLVLTWINKGEIERGGATDFVIWYLSKHTQKPFIACHNILNEGLYSHLSRWYMPDCDDNDNLRGSTSRAHAVVKARLEEKNWILSTPGKP